MRATHTADLNLDHIPLDLPPSTKHSSVFQELQHKALISIAQFCDAGYEAIFDEFAAYLAVKGSQTRTRIGTRNNSTDLWTMDTNKKTSNLIVKHANNAYTQKTLKDLVTYLHQAAFSPVPSPPHG